MEMTFSELFAAVSLHINGLHISYTTLCKEDDMPLTDALTDDRHKHVLQFGLGALSLSWSFTAYVLVTGDGGTLSTIDKTESVGHSRIEGDMLHYRFNFGGV